MYISEISTTQIAKGKDATQDKVFDLLDELKIPYECVENDVVEAMEECKEIDEKLGTEIRKSIFLCNRKKTAFFLVIMPAEKRLSMSELGQKLGKLSFASEEYMMQYLGCHPGSVSVMGVINDTQGKVQVVVDKEVADEEWFGCNPGINTAHLKLKTNDVLKKFLPKTGHFPQVMTI